MGAFDPGDHPVQPSQPGPSAVPSSPAGGTPSPLARLTPWLTAAALIALFVWSAKETEFSPAKFRNIANSIEFVRRSLPPRWDIIPDTLNAAVTTIHVAIMGTGLALAAALPVSILAASNTAPSRGVYHAVRWCLSLLRAVPEIVFALVLVPAIGLGPFPGVMALFLHNFGVLGKLIAELVEGANPGPQQAVLSAGASRPLVILFGIVPDIVPEVLSQAFYRLEVNVRQTIVLGFIGAGGIGHELFLSFRVFQYSEVIIQVAAIVLLVVLVDNVSAFVRRRVI